MGLVNNLAGPGASCGPGATTVGLQDKSHAPLLLAGDFRFADYPIHDAVIAQLRR